MGITKNHFLGLVKTRDEPAQFVSIHKNTIKQNPYNESLVSINVAKGRRRYLRSIPARLFDKKDIPKSWVSIFPCGLKGAIHSPDSAKFLCTLRDVCHEQLHDEHAKVLVEYNDYIKKHHAEVKELDDKITTLKGEIRLLRQTVRKQEAEK